MSEHVGGAAVSGSGLLPEVPGVVERDSEPGRLALRLIERAIDLGWQDSEARAALARGRQAFLGLRWRSNPGLDAELLRHRAGAVRWLASEATPSGYELIDGGDVIVLIGRKIAVCGGCRAGEHELGTEEFRIDLLRLVREECRCEDCDCSFHRVRIKGATVRSAAPPTVRTRSTTARAGRTLDDAPDAGDRVSTARGSR